MIILAPELKQFVTVRAALDLDRWIFVRYRMEAAEGKSLLDAAVRTALVASLGTVVPLSDETEIARLESGPRVLFPDEDENSVGFVTIAYPKELFSGSEGISQLIALTTFGSEFRYTKSIRVQSFELPSSVLSKFGGPVWGAENLRNALGANDRPVIGLIIKPRFGVSLDRICELSLEALLNGVDFIVDDELITDPPGEMAFNNRVPKLAAIAKKASNKTNKIKGYVANVSANPMRMRNYGILAERYGATAILMNGFITGFGALQDLAEDVDVNLPIITCNIGIALVSRHVIADGFSNAIFAHLSRVSGADGVHVGASSSDWHSPESWGPAVLSLNTELGGIRPALPIAAGGVRLSNVFQNVRSLGPVSALESGSGILGYPGGVKSASKYFRKLVELSMENTDFDEYKEQVFKLAERDKILKTVLAQDNFVKGAK